MPTEGFNIEIGKQELYFRPKYGKFKEFLIKCKIIKPKYKKIGKIKALDINENKK